MITIIITIFPCENNVTACKIKLLGQETRVFHMEYTSIVPRHLAIYYILVLIGLRVNDSPGNYTATLCDLR